MSKRGRVWLEAKMERKIHSHEEAGTALQKRTRFLMTGSSLQRFLQKAISAYSNMLRQLCIFFTNSFNLSYERGDLQETYYVLSTGLPRTGSLSAAARTPGVRGSSKAAAPGRRRLMKRTRASAHEAGRKCLASNASGKPRTRVIIQ